VKVLSIGAIAAAVLAVSAPAVMAQDFGYSDAYDWSGVYAGASVGVASTDPHSKFVTSQVVYPGPTTPISSIPIKSNPNGLVGGFQVGANQQFGNFVIGAEAEIGTGNVTANIPDPLIDHLGTGPGAPVAGDSVTSTSDINGSLLLRAGLGVGRFLPYIAAGISAAHVWTTATAGNADDSGVFGGWTVGGGVEMMVADNWSVRAQYLHSQLSGHNFSAGKFFENSSHPVTDSVTLGVNYKFN
jgi:outer membrane immunogenic protein